MLSDSIENAQYNTIDVAERPYTRRSIGLSIGATTVYGHAIKGGIYISLHAQSVEFDLPEVDRFESLELERPEFSPDEAEALCSKSKCLPRNKFDNFVSFNSSSVRQLGASWWKMVE